MIAVDIMSDYKIRYFTRLRPDDPKNRVEYANRLQQMCLENENFIHNIIMGGTIDFYTDGFVGNYNKRFWGSSQPQAIFPWDLSDSKVSLWCGITSKKVIGPYFFDLTSSPTKRLTNSVYIKMINEFIQPIVKDEPNLWWQQDGSSFQTAKPTMKCLRQHFENRIISLKSDFDWPSRSPDLTPVEYYLWGYLKDRVYPDGIDDDDDDTPEITIDELKSNIEYEVKKLNDSPDILRGVMQSVIERAKDCIEKNGEFLSNIVPDDENFNGVVHLARFMDHESMSNI